MEEIKMNSEAYEKLCELTDNLLSIVVDYDLQGTFIETISCKLYEYLRDCDTE